MDLNERSLFNMLTGYLSFGCALYAVGAFLALLKLKLTRYQSRELVLSDYHWVYVCMLLVLLDAARQTWDTFHLQHFPLAITRILVPYASLSMANSVFRIAKQNSTSRKPKEAPLQSDPITPCREEPL